MYLSDEKARKDGAYPNAATGFHHRLKEDHDFNFSGREKLHRRSGRHSKQTRELSDAPGSRNKDTILLVDEDESLRNLEKSVLASNGYTVLTAKDGEKALKVFSRQWSDIALVFADLALPKLRGDRLLQKMQKIDPGVRVIFAGGYVDAHVQSELLDAGAMGCVQKPNSADDIVAMIQGALNDR